MLKLFSAITTLFLLAPIARADEIHLMEQVAEGGMALVVIFFLSILCFSVSVERLINFREKHILSYDLLIQIKKLWKAKDVERTRNVLETDKSVLARVLVFILNNRHQSFDFVNNGAGEIASLELRKHQQKFYALAIVATVAPIVGLLGTVIGMVEAFHVIAFSQSMGNPALLAGGISKALINTAAGLSIALPALGMHHFLKYRSAAFSLLLEQELNQLINEWFLTSPETYAHSSLSPSESHEAFYAN